MNIISLLLVLLFALDARAEPTLKKNVLQAEGGKQVVSAKIKASPLIEQAVALWKKGSYADCIKLAESNIRRAGVSARDGKSDLYLIRGACQLGAGDLSESEQSLRTALSFRAADSDASYFLGVALYKQGKPAAALRSLEEALWFGKNRWVKNPEIYYRMGEIYGEIGHPEKAKQAWEKAISNDNTYFSAMAKLADVELAEGNKSRALQLLRQASTLSQDPDISRRLVEVLLLRVARNPSVAEAVEARTILDKFFVVRKGIAAYQDPSFSLRVKALLGSGEIASANRELQGALKSFPNNRAFLDLQRRVELVAKAESAALDRKSGGLAPESGGSTKIEE